MWECSLLIALENVNIKKNFIFTLVLFFQNVNNFPNDPCKTKTLSPCILKIINFVVLQAKSQQVSPSSYDNQLYSIFGHGNGLMVKFQQ